MAERKYDLALVHTESAKKIQTQPWYKERLRNKYIKSLKPGECNKALIGKDWVFLKDGLDDFRDGLPPDIDDGFLIKNNKGIGPNVLGSSNVSVTSVKESVGGAHLTKDHVCYARCTPMQQRRRDHISEIEYGLVQHPLALYPHLEECLPAEVFDEVVDILDPEMNMRSETSSSFSGSRSSSTEPQSQDEMGRETSGKHSEKSGSSRKEGEEMEGRDPKKEEVVRNPYRWLPRKEEKDKKDKKKASEKKTGSPRQERYIKSVTKEFCDWVASLGGESNNIEETTLTSLFASGYETKPALSVPMHNIELSSVPAELRASAVAPQQPNKNLPDQEKKKKAWVLSSSQYEPSWVKFHYGEWYLPQSCWKKRDWEVPLQDPRELKNTEWTEAKAKSDDLNKELSQMHGSKAFMDFMEKKGTRRAEFLNEISDIQRQEAEEIQLELATEQAKRERHSISVK